MQTPQPGESPFAACTNADTFQTTGLILCLRFSSVATVRLRRPIMRLTVLVVMVAMVLFLLALKTMLPVSGAIFTMLRFDSFPIRTSIRIMIHFAMMGVVLFRIGMEWIHFCHAKILF